MSIPEGFQRSVALERLEEQTRSPYPQTGRLEERDCTNLNAACENMFKNLISAIELLEAVKKPGLRGSFEKLPELEVERQRIEAQRQAIELSLPN